jgi:hypothetical protein
MSACRDRRREGLRIRLACCRQMIADGRSSGKCICREFLPIGVVANDDRSLQRPRSAFHIRPSSDFPRSAALR